MVWLLLSLLALLPLPVAVVVILVLFQRSMMLALRVLMTVESINV